MTHHRYITIFDGTPPDLFWQIIANHIGPGDYALAVRPVGSLGNPTTVELLLSRRDHDSDDSAHGHHQQTTDSDVVETSAGD